jgi:hypothetical protein
LPWCRNKLYEVRTLLGLGVSLLNSVCVDVWHWHLWLHWIMFFFKKLLSVSTCQCLCRVGCLYMCLWFIGNKYMNKYPIKWKNIVSIFFWIKKGLKLKRKKTKKIKWQKDMFLISSVIQSFYLVWNFTTSNPSLAPVSKHDSGDLRLVWLKPRRVPLKP